MYNHVSEEKERKSWPLFQSENFQHLLFRKEKRENELSFLQFLVKAFPKQNKNLGYDYSNQIIFIKSSSIYRMLEVVIKKLDRIRRNLLLERLWRKMHLMTWSEVIKPTAAGCLGLGDLVLKN